MSSPRMQLAKLRVALSLGLCVLQFAALGLQIRLLRVKHFFLKLENRRLKGG